VQPTGRSRAGTTRGGVWSSKRQRATTFRQRGETIPGVTVYKPNRNFLSCVASSLRVFRWIALFVGAVYWVHLGYREALTPSSSKAALCSRSG
jgi:hypothetical protein